MIKELCHGTYVATQFGELITVFAVGLHPTTGYNVYFEPYRMPNAYALIHERPQGIVGQLVTPFSVHTSYGHVGELKSVLIIDAVGRHDVPVTLVTKRELEVAEGGGGFPGPFKLPPIDGEAAHYEADLSTAVSNATGTGYSSGFSFEEALQNAISDARRHLPGPHIPDVPLKIEVTSMGAEIGGFGGLHVLIVHVIAGF
jgi:hypothetical protein